MNRFQQMKQFQLIVMVAAITAGIIWWSFYRSRHTSSAAVTSLLPKETLAFVHLPDFNRSRAELRQTDLYQIWTEPAVQEFLQKPRTKIPANRFALTIQECESLQLKDGFLALITIQDSAWKIVSGFRFKGDPADAERVVANWKGNLLGKAGTLKQELVEYQGHQIQAETAGIVRLFTVHTAQWFFVSNDLDQLKPVLDRVDKRVADLNTTLAADNVFSGAFKHMPSVYVALGFARVDQLVQKLMPRPEDGEDESGDQMEAIRQIRSLCGAISIDGGKIRDAIFVGMPKLLEAGTLSRASLPLATKDTFLYAAGFLNLTSPIPLGNTRAALGWMGGLRRIVADLSSKGVTLEHWNTAFGPEMSWVGNWPSSSHWPSLLATIPVKDAARAKDVLRTITATSPDSINWTHQEKDGTQYFSTRTSGAFFALSPTIGLSDRILVAGADTRTVEAAMKRISDGNSELAASKSFRTAERAVPAAQQVFTYIDPALLYTRVDATLRPMLLMSPAFLPGIADTVDLNKVPAPETITRHLSPLVMSQRYDGDGYIAESVGPLTVYQAIVGVGGLGGAAALLGQRQTSRLAGSLAPTATATPVPLSVVPSATPDDSTE